MYTQGSANGMGGAVYPTSNPKKINPVYIIIPIVLIIGIICGYFIFSSTKEKKLVCTRTASQNGLQYDFRYEVTYKGDEALQLKSIEKVTAPDTYTLQILEQSLKTTYAPYTNLDYYDNTVSIDGNTLTSTTTADYSKMDLDKLIEIDSANQSIVKDGKVQVEYLKQLYSITGATCQDE